ncbi:hypothetical protein HHI36_021705 [Cryptolaemus montrouzieri]|uniref:C2H2-type domain-containing protein n=1 Tax=Cryptolaemus montrouzieri TaxID=559131 RepID=A0ABD2MXV4_9CUCU
MDFSKSETTQICDFNEIEDKSFVNQFIDAEGKIWQRNALIETYKENCNGQTNNSYGTDLVKIEPEQHEEVFLQNKTVMDELVDCERKIFDGGIFIKNESCKNNGSDENEVVIPKVEAKLYEEDGKIMVHQNIDAKNWHEKSVLGDVKGQKVEEEEGNVRELLDTNSPTLKRYTCNFCDYSSPQRVRLKAHENSVHLNIKNHKCNQCDYQTAQKGHLKNHINNVHLGMKNHKCNQCDYQAFRKFYLTSHMNSVHFGIRSHKCSHCDYEATQKGHLKEHINSVHLGIKNHKCVQCDYETSRRNYLTTHIKKVHGNKSHKCSQCDYQTAQKSKLKLHIKHLHFSKKKEVRSYSNHEISEEGILLEHINNEKHKCSQCEYQTIRKGYLAHHVNSVHLGIKNHECSHCDYKTARADNLLRHIKRVHLGIKSHKCTHCDYEAYEKGHLSRHINSVHLGIKNHKCSHCDYETADNSCLKRHINKVHLK